ncbi:unnamed protein product, partial [Rotaria sordida]
MTHISASNYLLLCPISHVLFHDPVLAQDGHTYERNAIEEWIRRHGTSPMTAQPLYIKDLYPNHLVKKIVDSFEALTRDKKYVFTLDIDLRKKAGRLFQANGKTIYYAEWLPNNENRPKIVLLKIDGFQAKKEASFYVELTRHPNIVRTYGFVYDKNNNEQNKSVLLVQEYASDGNLYELLLEHNVVPKEKVLIQMFLQIIEAMIYLASNHIVHGDLACRNVLVFRFDSNNPEKNVVKITDFGLSRYSQLYSTVPTNAQTKVDIVPVRYAAPEMNGMMTEEYSQDISVSIVESPSSAPYTLIWLDASAKDRSTTQNELNNIVNNELLTFDSAVECQEYIQHTVNKIILIVSGIYPSEVMYNRLAVEYLKKGDYDSAL